MNELHNSIFENEKEFLERQKLEYKNALMGDVAVIKDQSERIGKKVLLAGGVLAGVWLVSSMVSGAKKKKKKKKEKARRKLLQSQNQYPAGQMPPGYNAYSQPYENQDQEVNFGSPLDFNQPADDSDSALYNTPAKYFNPPMPSRGPGNYALHQHYHAASEGSEGPSVAQNLGTELMRAVVTQVSAFLLVYLSQKVEAYLTKNPDIAAKTEPTIQETDIIYVNADAGTPL